VAMDAKASPETYASVVRCAASFDVVRKSIALLLEGRVACEFRTTVLPTFTLDDIEAIAREVQGASLYVLQQFRSALTDPLRAAALRDMPPHPAQWFADAARRAAPFVESCTLRGVDVPLAALADPSAA
jgi:pyruvate formate lyase activating enzyme